MFNTPRFFSDNIDVDFVYITGDDAWHITKVLRMRMGEKITVCNLNGTDFECVLTDIAPGNVTAQILKSRPCVSEPAVKIRLYQALPKADKLEFIVQKAVELGAVEIVPVLTGRCVSRWDAKTATKKIERLQKISLEAAKQSGRGCIAKILPLLEFEAAIQSMKTANRAILFYERAKSPLHTLLQGDFDSIAIMVGCEGGFSAEEAEYAKAHGVMAASLGTRILRCETAPIVALAAIGFACGEF